MGVIYTDHGLYQLAPFSNEAELEEAIQKVKLELFGANRIYLDVKKKIGKRGFHENIPDGYLIDLNSKTPRLYFVENELVSHDAVRHIAPQILGFLISSGFDLKKVRDILLEELHSHDEIKTICDNYISFHGYRNFDHFLNSLIENQFSVLVIIDEEHSKLKNAVIPWLKINVDVIHLSRYRNSDNNYYYSFTPFLQDVIEDYNGVTQVTNINPNEVDTIIVPARNNGFLEVFLNQNRWYEVRIESSMREKIKYIACYRVSPISAITHLARVKSIEPWGDNGKWVINFEGKAEEIKTIVLNKNGKVKAPQSHRYALRDQLLNATTLDEIWHS
ncbi:Uncharacterised protein [Legionella pneumophila]|nr:Uncharacterised protein [Legionella pneumophila]